MARRSAGVEILDSVVIGAGQAGLSTSYHLQRRGIDHVVLDADEAPGGAWQHRWDSLTMHDVHGIAALPDAEPLAEQAGRANDVVPAYFADYERAPPPAGAAAGPGGPGRRDGRRAARGACRRPALADPHDRERDRDVVAAVRAGVPGRRDVPRPPAAPPRLPGPGGVPRPASGRRGRRRVRRTAARRDRPRRRGHALGDPPRAGLAHRRLHPRGGAGRGRAGRGAGTPRAAAGQRRERHRARRCASRSARPSGWAPTSGTRCSPPSSPTACGCQTARTGRPT